MTRKGAWHATRNVTWPVDEREEPLKFALHQCRICGQSFPYHYEHVYDQSHLTHMDFVCRDCLADYVQRVEQQGGHESSTESAYLLNRAVPD